MICPQDEDASDGDCNGLRGQSEVQDRKALRKAKNRASAAASRARREAYTASLEEEASPSVLVHSSTAGTPLLSGVTSQLRCPQSYLVCMVVV